MLTDEQIDAIGIVLEDNGMSHSEIDAYFAHYGKKGMKWGVRRKMIKAYDRGDLSRKDEARLRADTRRKVRIGAAAIGAVLIAHNTLRYAAMRSM